MRLLCKGTIAALALTASAAVVAIGSPYVALRGSLAFSEDMTSQVSGIPLRASFDTGWGVSAALGNEFGPVHLELEGVYRNFGIDKVKSGAVTTSPGGNVDVVAPMANVILDFPLDGYFPAMGITPFVGAGLGGMHVSLNPNTAVSPIKDDESWGFAYQLMGGLSVPIANNVTMRLAYRYLASPNLRFHATSGAGYKTDMEIHSVDLGLDFRF